MQGITSSRTRPTFSAWLGGRLQKLLFKAASEWLLPRSRHGAQTCSAWATFWGTGNSQTPPGEPSLIPHQTVLPFPGQASQDPQDSQALTWGYLSAGSTRLSMARTKAAVLPVPDWDWAIRFCGLDQERKEIKIVLVNTKRCQNVLSGCGRNMDFPPSNAGFLHWTEGRFFYMLKNLLKYYGK